MYESDTSNPAYFSPHHQKSEYIELHLTKDSGRDKFDIAIDLFKDRIKGRFLDQIESLSSDYGKNGFAIMALECLLVETFAQFRKGLPDTDNCSKEEYAKFLFEVLHCCASITVARKFYSYIRCGILHQAQTKPNSGLAKQGTRPISYSSGFLLVSVPAFIAMMNDYFESYCADLYYDPILRSNFVTKMNYICGCNN